MVPAASIRGEKGIAVAVLDRHPDCAAGHLGGGDESAAGFAGEGGGVYHPHPDAGADVQAEPLLHPGAGLKVERLEAGQGVDCGAAAGGAAFPAVA